MNKKIVIFYATAGIGHKKAAIAIKDAFERAGKKDVLLADALEYTTGFFKVAYLDVYLFLVRYMSPLWGFFYYTLDHPWIFALATPFRRMTNYLNSFKLVKFLVDTKPDIIIVTHFFALDVVAALKRKNIIRSSLICVMTDYESHLFWISKYVDTYVVGSDYTRDNLIKRGIPAEKIKSFGIPCARSFYEKRDPGKLREKLGLSAHKNTVFILGGGFGVGPVEAMARYLDKTEIDFQAIVVCGYNKKLREKMDDFARNAKSTFKIYGFVDNVDELMSASDVLISKTGGITVAESLAAELPMLVLQPIKGQEMRNCKFLLKEGAAIRLRHPKELPAALKKLLSGDGLDKIRQSIKRIRKGHSARSIVELTYEE